MKRALIYGILAILLGMFLYALWYKNAYAQGVLKEREINSPVLEDKILIASQESEYKVKLVDQLVDRLENDSTYIRIIDATELGTVSPAEYDALFIVYAWEMWEPLKAVKSFVDQDHPSKVYFISTSGDGDMKISGVDGVTSASRTQDIPNVVGKAMAWMKEQEVFQ